jgi:N-ethylmaleimide reductase
MTEILLQTFRLGRYDLPHRFCRHARLSTDGSGDLLRGGAIGYIDYPTLAQERGEEPKLQIDERWR